MESDDSGELALSIVQNRLSNNQNYTSHMDTDHHISTGSENSYDQGIQDDDDQNMSSDHQLNLSDSNLGQLEHNSDPSYQEPLDNYPDQEADDDTAGGEEDEDDDIPLAAQVSAFSRLKKKRQPKTPPAVDPLSDLDDDVPLVTRLSKPAKSPSRVSAPARNARAPARNSDTKPKKPVKRAPRAKKEDEAPSRKFEKLGQRREAPPDNDPSRLFYQSMYHEKIALGKKSFIAGSWMLRNGLLGDREAEKVMARWDLKR